MNQRELTLQKTQKQQTSRSINIKYQKHTQHQQATHFFIPHHQIQKLKNTLIYSMMLTAIDGSQVGESMTAS